MHSTRCTVHDPEADKGGCPPLLHPLTKTGRYLSDPLVSAELMIRSNRQPFMLAKDITGPCMGQYMGSMFQPKQTRRPDRQPGTLSSTGSMILPTHYNGGSGLQQNVGVDGDHRGEVAIWREGNMYPQQQAINTPPLPGHFMDYRMRTDHKQNQKGDLYGKQVYEQRSVAEFQLQKERRHQDDEDYIKQLRTQIDRLENENGSLKHDLKVTQSELADTRNLSQIRAEELQGAQAFLDKADVLSTADIVEKVNILNSEISQTASLLVDLLHNAESHHRTQRQPTEMTNCQLVLGEKLARDLHALSNNPTAMNKRRRETNHWQLLFLVVFHIAITKWCSIMVNSWVPNNRTLSDSIASIYSGIRQVSE